jgi:hypothetical protein
VLTVTLGILCMPASAFAKPDVELENCSGTTALATFTLQWVSGSIGYQPDDVYMSYSIYDGSGNEVTGPIDFPSSTSYYAINWFASNQYTYPIGASLGQTVALNGSADYNPTTCSYSPSSRICCDCCCCCCCDPCCNNAIATARVAADCEIADERPTRNNHTFTVPVDITNKGGAETKVHFVYNWFYRPTVDSHMQPILWADDKRSRRGTAKTVPLPTINAPTTTSNDCTINLDTVHTAIPANSEIIVVIHARSNAADTKPLYVSVTSNYQP